MSSTSYATNLSKIRKIITSVQSVIQDLETSITQTESIITNLHAFKHLTSDDPTLVEPGTILPLSTLLPSNSSPTFIHHKSKPNRSLSAQSTLPVADIISLQLQSLYTITTSARGTAAYSPGHTSYFHLRYRPQVQWIIFTIPQLVT